MGLLVLTAIVLATLGVMDAGLGWFRSDGGERLSETEGPWLLVGESDRDAWRPAPAPSSSSAQAVTWVAVRPPFLPAAVGARLASLPRPLPALMMTAPEALGFFHPLSDLEQVDGVLAAWPILMEHPFLSLSRSPPAKDVAPVENWVVAGGFEGACLSDFIGTGPWQWYPKIAEDDDVILESEIPDDRPLNPALWIGRRKPGVPDARKTFCCQWIGRKPKHDRQIMVLRFRARAVHGSGLVHFSGRHWLDIPQSATGPMASRLRQVSQASPHNPPKSDPPRRWWYRVSDSVRPTARWQAFHILWEWPRFNDQTKNFALEIGYIGTGMAHVDDIEMFPLPKP